jgi:AraC-like DNA-binding protein
MVTGLDAALMQRIGPANGVVSLLAGYLRTVARQQLLASPAQDVVVGHVHDLVAVLASATGAFRQQSSMRGLRAARLQAIQSNVIADLENPGLTASRVAARQRLSARYVHYLFAEIGTTFSAFVLEQRLARAHRLLRDAAYDRRTIADIAYAVGFGDLSYFNRTFRRRYGCSPRDIRQRSS